MKETLKYGSLIVLALLLVACGPSAEEVAATYVAQTAEAATNTPVPTNTSEPTATSTPIPYNVTIEVIDENGNPLPDAKIMLDETVEFTDDQGLWRKTSQLSELSLSVWAQGYLLQNYSSSLQSGENNIQIQLSEDPVGLEMSDLALDGYELVFVEDFQDNIADCVIEGNGNVVVDDTNPENYLLLADLRNIDESFTCSFGPTNLEDAILEADFRYPEIRFTDAEKWQGYTIGFRDGFVVEGFPIHVPWDPTLQIRDFSGDSWEFPVHIKQGIQENRWYTLNTKYDGQKVEVRMDGKLRFNFLNPPTMISTEPSFIGAFVEAHIQFDNIKMWIPVE